MKIGDIDLEKKVLIIAEIGSNHGGNYDKAVKLIEMASEAGVDAVKFQTYRADKIVSITEIKAREKFRRFELSDNQFIQLSETARQKGLLFLSTPFDLDSVELLNPLVPAFKVASGDITFFPLLEQIASKNKPIILSTGMSEIWEINEAIKVVANSLSGRFIQETLILLHCTTIYPTNPSDANLLNILTLKNKFGLTVGYSDHTMGITACIVSVALGARVVEKHFTDQKERRTFKDHQLSADLEDMRLLVQQIRKVEILLGNTSKYLLRGEKENVVSMRRSLAASKTIKKGEILNLSRVTYLRPATGVKPTEITKYLGKEFLVDKVKGQIIFPEDLG